MSMSMEQAAAAGRRSVLLVVERFRHWPARDKRLLLVGSSSALLLVVLFYLAGGGSDDRALAVAGHTQSKHRVVPSSDARVRVLQQDLSWGGGGGGSAATATLVLELERHGENNEAVATGSQHKARVLFGRGGQQCPFPRFAVRLVGPTLVPVLLVQQQEPQDGLVWTAESLHIPLAGRYRVEAQWYGCHTAAQAAPAMRDDSFVEERQALKDDATGEKATMLEFVTEGPLSLPGSTTDTDDDHKRPRPKESYLFANAAWISTKEIKPNIINPDTKEPVVFPDYMWLDPTLDNPLPQDFQYFAKESENVNTTVSLRGTFTEAGKVEKSPKYGHYLFNHVGNYELVCFWGSQSMADIRSRFMMLRGRIEPAVRPFKFHYYNVTNLQHPDALWEYKQKATCRKCKHIIVSVDELDEPLSQAAFQAQYTTFVNHLLKLMDDSTFPIWLLTNNEPPSMPTNCQLSPNVLPRSTGHPCNDVILDLFRTAAFPDRVHLLDNTDLVLPLSQFDDDNYQRNRDHVLFNIGLRIMTAVGKGVADWRAMGQSGRGDGLHRNGTVEPNFALVPYNWDG